MNNQFKYAYIAYQPAGNAANVFYSVGYPEMPVEVDLENFVVDVRTDESIGLIGKGFEVALLNAKEDNKIMKKLHL